MGVGRGAVQGGEVAPAGGLEGLEVPTRMDTRTDTVFLEQT